MVSLLIGSRRRPDLHLEPRKSRTDGAEAVALGTVEVRRRRALREAVALEDADADRVEEVGDLLREGSATGDRYAQAAADALPHLREDEAVCELVSRLALVEPAFPRSRAG